MDVVKTIPVVLQRMDSVITEPPDVIKVDTQGTELHVLQGAGALLDGTIAVEIEVEFVEQYLNQPLFADVDNFMRSKGFVLRGLRRTYWRNTANYVHSWGGQLVHGDALYFHMDLLNSPAGHVVLSAYRQYDLLAALGATRSIPRPSPLRTLFGRIKSNREMRRFVDSLRPVNATDWHDPDFF